MRNVRFIDAIRIKNTLIDVDAVEVEYAAATGDYDDFYRLVCEGEADGTMDKIIEYLKELIDVNVRGFSGRILEMRGVWTEIRGVRTEIQADLKISTPE